MRSFSIRKILATQLILLAITLTSCKNQNTVPFPEELIGTWISEHEQYKDKYIYISRDAVSFGGNTDIYLTTFVKRHQKEEREGEWTLFCENDGGVAYNYFLIVQENQGDLLLKLKNREHVIWKKLEAYPSELTQQPKQLDARTTPSNEINTAGLKVPPVEADAIGTRTQQVEHNREPVKEPHEFKADVLETVPARGNFVASGARQTEKNRETEKQSQIKPLHPRKVVLGFKPNSLELTGGGLAALDEFLTKFKQYPRATVLVKGFVAAKTNSVENIELSTKRAQAVEKLLFKVGIDPIQVEIVGMGNKDPIDSNDTRSGRKKNRRVEIKVINDGTELR